MNDEEYRLGLELPGGGGPALAGRRAVVTGAGRGIGRAVALALARAGADIGAVSRTSQELEALGADVDALGRNYIPVICDVTNPEEVTDMADAMRWGLGGIDILVNAAGGAESHKFVGQPDEIWHRMIALNLTGVYYVTKEIVPALIENGGGRIVNIASIAARVGDKYVSAYTAAKHGVLGLTRALATELVEHNITVNAVCPGFVDTPMTESAIANIVARTGMSEDEARRALESTSPQKRLITPEEVAATVVFLASDLAKGITGQAINIDGGRVMS
jgi:NAD(P)-dependent dehydrogenase (short-subunit alcohol dehydrogenase family)